MLHGGSYDGKYYAVPKDNPPYVIQMAVPPEPVLVTSEYGDPQLVSVKREIYQLDWTGQNYYFKEIE